MSMHRTLITFVSILLIIIIAEMVYLFMLKPNTETNVTNSNSQTSEPQSSDVNSVIAETFVPIPSAQATYFPTTPTSTPIPMAVDEIRNKTQRMYDIMRSTSYITKDTQLLQEYEGTISEIDFLDEEIPIPVYNETYTISLKLGLQANQETPKIFYYSPETESKIRVFDNNGEEINLDTLLAGDRINIKITYNVNSTPSVPNSIELTKLN